MSYLAHFLRRQQRYDQARKLIEQSLESQRLTLGPDHIETLQTLHNLAKLLGDQGKYEEGRKLFEQELELVLRTLRPDHMQAREARHWAEVMTLQIPDPPAHDLRRALEVSRELVKQDPSDQHLWKWLALAEYRHGHWDAAIEDTEKCIKARGDRGWAFQWVVLALAHARRGEMDKAREWYAKVPQGTAAGEGWADTPRWLIDEAKDLLGVKPTPGEAAKEPNPKM